MVCLSRGLFRKGFRVVTKRSECPASLDSHSELVVGENYMKVDEKTGRKREKEQDGVAAFFFELYFLVTTACSHYAYGTYVVYILAAVQPESTTLLN